MVYLIDACVLIQAKNSHYAFDLCPGFWDWLAARNLEGVVYSVDKVSEELKAQTDELSQWAADQGANFFLKVDQQTESALSSVSGWVESGEALQYIERALKEQKEGANNETPTT